jgi:hypothetical protein
MHDNDFVDTGYDPNSDYVDGLDLECDDDLGIDYHEELGQLPDSVPDKPPQNRENRENKARQAKIKPMPASYRKVFPNVSSILITRFDGKQILFVRGK